MSLHTPLQTANGASSSPAAAAAAGAGTTTVLADSAHNTADARIYEYVSACNPDMPPIPALAHPPQLHEEGKEASVVSSMWWIGVGGRGGVGVEAQAGRLTISDRRTHPNPTSTTHHEQAPRA